MKAPLDRYLPSRPSLHGYTYSMTASKKKTFLKGRVRVEEIFFFTIRPHRAQQIPAEAGGGEGKQTRKRYGISF